MIPLSGIYVVGGHVRQNVFRKLAEWQSCDMARIIQLDPGKEEAKTCVEYVSPPEACPEEVSAILFKSAFLDGDVLYACTSTEVLIYRLPEFRCETYISLPCFNDCLLYTSPSPRDRQKSRMPSSA